MKIDLEKKYNIVQNKTKILKPINSDNNNLILSYICGLIDGDGCICAKTRNEGIALHYISSSKQVVEWMHNYLDKLANYEYRIPNKVGKQKNAYQFQFQGVKAAIIIDRIRQLPIYKMDRKWNNPVIIERIDKIKQKYPHLFLQNV